MKFFDILFIIFISQILLPISLSLIQPVLNKNNNHINNINKSQRESDIVPKWYNIKFYLNKNFSFNGEVEIQAQVTAENNQIVLDYGSNIVINSLSIINNGTVIDVLSSNYNKKNKKLSCYLNNTLPTGLMITINISYSGDVSKHIKSSQTFSYWKTNQELKKITTLQYKLSFAKEVVPCINCHSKTNISMRIWRSEIFMHPKYSCKHHLLFNTNQTYTTETYNSPGLRTMDFIPYLITDIGQLSIKKWVQKHNNKQWSSTIRFLQGKNYLQIDEVNRASIIDHLFNSANKKLIGYDLSLAAAQYLVQERSYLPWKTAFTHFEYLNKKLSQSDIKQMWKKYLFTILNTIYHELKFTEGVDDSDEKKMLRSDIIKWTCGLSHFDCISRSLEIFNNWRLNESRSIPVKLQQSIFCTAVKWGTHDNWNFLWTKYLQTDITSEKNGIMHALSCTEDYETIDKLLLNAITKDSGIKFEDSPSVFTAVYLSGVMGAQKVVNFIKNNYQIMSNYYKNDSQLLWMNSYSNTIQNDCFKSFDPKGSEWLSYAYPNGDRHLPRKVKPLKYHIRIIPHLEAKRSIFNGLVSITLDVLDYTSCIVLHAKGLTISKINVYDPISLIPYGVSKYFNDSYDKLNIYLETIVRCGSRLILDIKYTGFINKKMRGLFRGSYEYEKKNINYLATQFERFDARRVFPCFDEPALKASFKISIMRPNYYHTLSNMQLKHSVASGKSNWTWDHYEESISMSTYLVAFVIFEYKYNYSLNSNIKLWSYMNSTNKANHILELTQSSFEYLEDYTSIRYPMKKLDLVIIPNFHIGGMENWGLITLSDTFPVQQDESYFSMYYESLVVHEVAHMWFGNLVTCDSWEYLWLNEGFATYFQWTIMASIKPEWNWIDTFVAYEMHDALKLDSAIDSVPMNDKQRNYIDDIGDMKMMTIAYEKSACIIRMIEHTFGAEILHQALKYYLRENQLKTVTPLKLWTALDIKIQEVGGIPGVNQPVSTLMEPWISQSGYPVVHVNRINGNLSLTQEQFFITKRNESSTQLYWIPISITSQSNPNFSNTSPTLWMGSQKLLTSLSMADDEWVILNVQQTGFYRVNYDVITWKNLFKALNQDNFGGIPEIHRTQIIDDLFNLATSGYISYDLVFAGSKYLLNEKARLPWKAFNTGFYNTYGDLKNENTEEYSKKKFKEVIFPSRDKIISKEPLNNKQLDIMKEKLFYFWSCRKDSYRCMYQEKN